MAYLLGLQNDSANYNDIHGMSNAGVSVEMRYLVGEARGWEEGKENQEEDIIMISQR